MDAAAADWLILDRQCAIIGASTISGIPENSIGTVLWEIYPEGERLFGPTYQAAWKTGRAETTAFHMGRLIHVEAERTAVGLIVTYRVLGEVDTVTLMGLSLSLDRLADLLARAERGCGRPSRPALQIVPRTPEL